MPISDVWCAARLTVSAAGRVEGVAIIDCPSEMYLPMEEAWRAWLYAPLQREGVATPFSLEVSLFFSASRAAGGDLVALNSPLPTHKRVQPEFPMGARYLGESGKCVVRVVVGEDGKVLTVFQQSCPDLFWRETQAAVAQWEFEPYTQDGTPKKAIFNVSFSFNVRERDPNPVWFGWL